METITRPLSLLSLPDDILSHVLLFLPTQRDICFVCLTCRRLNTLADPILHKDVLFEEPRHHATFLESLATRPRRSSLIQKVRVEYPSSEISDYLHRDESGYPIDKFSHSISRMTNLVSLVVSVPESLSCGIGHVFNGPFDLAFLQSCTLFYQCENDEYWDLQANIHVFSHPTLENLVIRRARLNEEGFEFLQLSRGTALKNLQLIECDINIDALYDILHIPEALKEITITQLEIPEPPLQEASDLVDDYISAIEVTRDSLESMVIDFSSLSAKEPMRLREFSHLSRLEIRDYQLFGQATPRLLSVGLPSNLETLKFFGQVGNDEEISELLCNTIERKNTLARRWTKMIVEGPGRPPPNILDVCEKFDGFLVETKQVRRRLVSTDSVIMEISSPLRDKFEMLSLLEQSGDS